MSFVARFWRRLAAGVLDWTLCSAAWLFLLSRAGYLGLILGCGLVITYFAVFWSARAATPGMRALRLGLERQPRAGRAFARALLACITAISTLAAFSFFIFSDKPNSGYSGADLAVGYAALALTAVAACGHLWALVDHRGQSWQDKLFRLTTLTAKPGVSPPTGQSERHS
jgi:uncharacterized RDD family membrane protein YckC